MSVFTAAEFSTYLRYTRQLDFFELPDYNYVRGLFTGLMAANGWQCDWDFDWASRHTVCLPCSMQSPRCSCLQCFDAVGWAAGRASGL